MLTREWIGRRTRVLVGTALAFGFTMECQRAWSGRTLQAATPAVAAPAAQVPVRSSMAAYAAPSPDLGVTEVPLEVIAAKDPIAFIQRAIDQYDRSVRDYTCTFTKKELVCGEMTEEQVMNAMFREKPFSVRLEWTKNADKAARVLYVADRWMQDGNQMAVVEPGAIARLFVSYVMRPVHGEDAAKSSRRTIDQFGLRNSLGLTLKYCMMAKEKGILKFEYIGNGKVDNRETLMFERHLPYNCEGGMWPDRVLVVHIDKKMMVPTLCTAYADDAKKVLLGKYMCTNVKLNVNLRDSVFTKEGMGL
jgi:hypothetical protein